MGEKKKNLSEYTPFHIPSAQKLKIGMVVSEWNDGVTSLLKEAAYSTLVQHGIEEQHITLRSVPGSFELPSAAVMMLEADDSLDAVICIGCIIQGETRHFEFIAQAVADGIMRASIDYVTPVIFGVLTCNTMEQAMERAGGSCGNKGTEAAVSCLKMLAMERSLH